MTKKLPRITLPLFEDIIPSTGEKVKFVPMTLKEEKILMIAKQSKDADQIILAIKQVLNNCLKSVNVEKLANFDVDYLMLKLRGKSVSNIVEFKVQGDDGKPVDIILDIDDVKISRPENHSNNIKLTDDMVLVMKYPTIDVYKLLAKNQGESQETRPEDFFQVLISCADSVIEGDSIYKFADFSKSEIDSFFEDLTEKNIDQISNFFNTMPVLRVECKYIQGDEQKTVVIEGSESFFI